MEKFKIIHTSKMLSSVSTDSALAWSSDHQLSVVTSKGIYIMDIVPNSTNASPVLNTEPIVIPNDKLPNPWQKNLGVNWDETEKTVDSMQTNILLDNAIHVGSTGNAENELLKQVSCVKWTNNICGPLRSSLVTLTHGNR